MTDHFEDYTHVEDIPLQALDDDCSMLKNLLDDCLRLEVGDSLFTKLERIKVRGRRADLEMAAAAPE